MAKNPQASVVAEGTLQAPSLSLPAEQFAKLAPESFLAAHLPTQRSNGRTLAQARQPTLNAHSLTHAHGSAVVRLGNTAVVCGIRGEIVLGGDTLHRSEQWAEQRSKQGGGPDPAASNGTRSTDADDITALGLLVPNIELATGCSPGHLPGNPPTALAQSLTQRVLSLLRISDLVRFKQLQIWAPGADGARESHGADGDGDEDMEEDEAAEAQREELQAPQVMAFWTLYIDILVISLDGSAFDVAWAAVLGALRNTRLPDAWWDRDREAVVCDPRAERVQALTPRGCPVALSFVAFNPPVRVASTRTEDTVHVLVDPDTFEEECGAQMITIVVDEGGARVLRIEMSGGGLLDPSDMLKLIKRTGQRWEEWRFVLEAV